MADINIPPEDYEKIQAVANQLAMSAVSALLPEAKMRPVYIVAALSQALATAATIVGVSYESLIKLVSAHHEGAQRYKIEQELKVIGVKPPKPIN